VHKFNLGIKRSYDIFLLREFTSPITAATSPLRHLPNVAIFLFPIFAPDIGSTGVISGYELSLLITGKLSLRLSDRDIYLGYSHPCSLL
jgi:hypothetical protein